MTVTAGRCENWRMPILGWAIDQPMSGKFGFCFVFLPQAHTPIMANTQFAFMRRSQVPGADALQASIDNLGFDLKLDPNLNLLDSSGFSPCTLSGIADVGFEIIHEPVANIVASNGQLQAVVGDRDICIGFVWRGSMRDCASVMIVSSALAKDFGAVISLEGDPPEPLEALIQGAGEIAAEAKDERRRRR